MAAAAVATCNVWWAQPLRDLSAAADLLDDAERGRCDALRAAQDRARFVTGRVLARRALAAELGTDPAAIVLLTRCPTCGGPHGKPVLGGDGTQPAIELSISHAGERVVAATSRGGPVGVDVERLGPVGELAGLDAGVLAEAERAAFDAVPLGERESALRCCWTRKEAVLKRRGRG